MRQHSSSPKKKPFRRPFQHKFKQPPENIPARIHAILAREAPKAVVFRRGPSGCVCTLGWDLETAEFPKEFCDKVGGLEYLYPDFFPEEA
jgi:hypothetical protein